MTKEIKTREECYIEFSDEELAALDWQPGDKLSWQITDEGVSLKKCEEIDIDLEEFTKEELIDLITVSSARDITVEELIVDVLREAVEGGENSDDYDVVFDEYHDLLNSGQFWLQFPSATGVWHRDLEAYENYLDIIDYKYCNDPSYEPLPMLEWLKYTSDENFENNEWRQDKRADSETF